MATIGYARVSSSSQKLDYQIQKLREYGCDVIFQETGLGTDDGRKELNKCLDSLSENDKLVVTKLDRLACSTLHLTSMAERLNNRGVDLVVLIHQIDTSTPTGRLLFNMLASIAEFEIDLRRERQAEGIAYAQQKGVKFGAKAKLSDNQKDKLKADRRNGLPISELLEKYQISRATLYRLT